MVQDALHVNMKRRLQKHWVESKEVTVAFVPWRSNNRGTCKRSQLPAPELSILPCKCASMACLASSAGTAALMSNSDANREYLQKFTGIFPEVTFGV